MKYVKKKMHERHLVCQGAYNSGKPGNLREFVNYGELGEFEIYSGISCISDAVFS